MSKIWEPKVSLSGDKNYTVSIVENNKVRRKYSHGEYEDGEVNVGRIGSWSHT